MDIAPERIGAVKEILQQHQSTGIVEVLQESEWDDKPRPPAAYLYCLSKLQGQFATKYRHFMLLTGKSPPAAAYQGMFLLWVCYNFSVLSINLQASDMPYECHLPHCRVDIDFNWLAISDMRPDSLEAETFYQHGLGVFNVPLFMQHIVEKKAYPPLRIPLPGV